MAYDLDIPESFRKTLRGKPPKSQEAILDAVNLLAEDYRHPSLRAAKLTGAKGLFYARASRSDRVTYEVQGGTIVLRANCSHQDILGK